MALSTDPSCAFYLSTILLVYVVDGRGRDPFELWKS